jgi:hypothetical protein
MQPVSRTHKPARGKYSSSVAIRGHANITLLGLDPAVSELAPCAAAARLFPPAAGLALPPALLTFRSPTGSARRRPSDRTTKARGLRTTVAATAEDDLRPTGDVCLGQHGDQRRGRCLDDIFLKFMYNQLPCSSKDIRQTHEVC